MSRSTGLKLAIAASILAIPLFAGACTDDPDEQPPGTVATASAPPVAAPDTSASASEPSASAQPPADTSPSATTQATGNASFGASTGDTEVVLIKSKWSADYVESAANLGVGTSRFDVKWDSVQPSRGARFDFSAYAPIVQAMVERGIEPQPIFGSTPKWAAAPGCKRVYFECPPANINEAAAFAAAFATKFGSQVTNYELTDSPQGRINPQRYVELLQLTAAQIRTVDSDAKIILSMDPGTDWPTQLYKLGAAGSFDGFNVQAMTWPASVKKSTMPTTITAMYNVMANHGDGTKFIQLTVGFPTAGRGSVTANRQGPLLVDAFESAAALKKSGVVLGAVFIFSLRDIGPVASTNPWDHMGLATQNGSPKPAWDIVKNYISTHP